MKKKICFLLILLAITFIPTSILSAAQSDSRFIAKVEQKIVQGFKNDAEKQVWIDKVNREIDKTEFQISVMEKVLSLVKIEKARAKIIEKIEDLQVYLDKLQELLKMLIVPIPDLECAEGTKAVVILEDHDSSGAILWGNDINGVLVYCTQGGEYKFAFSGKTPVANDWYALVIGEDPRNDPETAVIVDYSRSDGNTGGIHVSKSIELNRDLVNTEVWLVLGGDLMLLPRYDGYTAWSGWNPESYLFSTKSINYHDTTPKFLLKWGSEGTNDGQFYGSPYAVETDSQGNVFVLDEKRVQKFTPKGEFIAKSEWGTGGSGLAIDSQDNIYVVDHSIYDTVKKFNNDLNFLSAIHQELITTSPWPGYVDIAIDANDNLFIAARWKVVKMDTNGNIIKEWGSRCSGGGVQSTEVIGSDSQNNVCYVGEFADAQAIGVDSSSKVYVIENWFHHVQVFDNNGNYLNRWGGPGSNDGYFRTPFGGAFDSEDNIYIADYENNRVQELTTDGTFILKWGSSYSNPGSGQGEFYGSRDVAVDSEGSIYVADSGNYRIQKFSK